jgi:uncharacterized protein YdeI (YjbR/CyaY-like superfamily)
VARPSGCLLASASGYESQACLGGCVRRGWERWIEACQSDLGVRLRLRKKSSRLPGPTYPEALDVALCHGWIDGQVEALDDDYFLQTFTPRRRNSPWSKINRGHVERLTADGGMRPAGQAEIDRAKTDGRWDAAYRQADNEIPQDLQAELDQRPVAASAFAALTSQNRFAIVFRLNSVKRAETRTRKLAEYISMLERGDTIYPQKKPT